MPSEWEHMRAGRPYDPLDADLTERRRHARRLTGAYNATSIDEPERRRALLEELFGAIGPEAYVELPFRCDYGANIHAAERLFLNFGCVVLDCAEVRIGARAQIGPGTHLYACDHPTDPAIRRSGYETAAPIVLGDDVWIGGQVVIGPGVTVGEGAVVGAGAVVLGDVPAGVLVVGNPARVVREVG